MQLSLALAVVAPVSVLCTFALAAVTLVALVFVRAPYGRYVRRGWGPSIPSPVGWFVMESPAVVAFVAIYLAGAHRAELGSLLLLALWQTHYVYRAFVYPFRMRATRKPMPVLVAALAFGFNLLNAWNNASRISHKGYPAGFWHDPRFLAGALVFAAGQVINRRADATLFRLRKPGETGYAIPHGGLYEYVSCPNYLGEIIEWFGWALATWSLAGLSFAVYTVANVAPRAIAHHAWYRKTFPDYPSERRALIPFVL